MAGKLPPGVTAKRFAKAIAGMRGAVGAAHVLTDGIAELPNYSDPCAIFETDHFAPSAAVLPGSVRDVQEIVRIAGEFGVPLSPISTGKTSVTAERRLGCPGRSWST